MVELSDIAVLTERSWRRASRSPARTVSLLCCLAVAANALASPRQPRIAVPERNPILHHERFDEPYVWGMTNSVVVSGDFTFVESWSGLALDRSGGSVAPFEIAGVSSAGHTNIVPGGAVRFWVSPYWSSSSLTNGGGPGAYARLADLNAIGSSGTVVLWSLQVSPDGSNISLVGQTGSGPAQLLQANIAWAAGTPHCLILNCGTNTELYLDGELAAQGTEVLSVSPAIAELTMGSSIGGGEPAQGALDDVTLFSRPFRPEEVEYYYHAMSHVAALGPVSPEEEAARAAYLAGLASGQSSGSFSFSGADIAGCDASGPLYLTNVACSFVDTNQGWVCSFDVHGGGSADTLWEVWGTTNLVTGSWSWLANTHTCLTVTLTNQPPVQSFYLLANADILSHDGHGTPDAWYWLHGLNPLTSGIADQDPNNDGIPNWQEYLRGTDPVASKGWNVWIGTPWGLSDLP